MNPLTLADLRFTGNEVLRHVQSFSGQSTKQTQDGGESINPKKAAIVPIIRLGIKVNYGASKPSSPTDLIKHISRPEVEEDVCFELTALE